MAAVLRAENAPRVARVLVVCAGGGKELGMIADTRSGWTVDGVDPSEEMLDLAKRTVGSNSGRGHLDTNDGSRPLHPTMPVRQGKRLCVEGIV
ncbi:class I SAM-dependent methyltransferase [Mycolicibacterium porcinum]|uniref:class I SAM-dependent methyltransferase n=1 Tax=Mycolicibacterium porcinum TaxID=39693 RepID=UPI0013F4D531|nr:class I SAM-dependent methyltransferase [Mycolicibacterium porcinum]